MDGYLGNDVNAECKVMHVERNNQTLPYMMSGQKMSITEVEKDLGVMISNDLKSKVSTALRQRSQQICNVGTDIASVSL